MRPARRRPFALVLAAALGIASLFACTREKGPEPALDAFLAAWQSGTFEPVKFVSGTTGEGISPDTVKSELQAFAGDLAKSKITVAKKGKPAVQKDDANGAVSVDWAVAAGVNWTYDTTVRLHRKDGDWRVVWEAALVHPELRTDEKLVVRRLGSERGSILARSGEAIVKARPVVVVGIHPRTVTNAAALFAELDAAFKSQKVSVDIREARLAYERAKPDDFVEIVTLRREIYDRIRIRIRPLDGTQFREETRQLAPTRAFARALLGAVGPVLKEQMDANPGKYVVGDQVGQGGLQEQYDDQLRGTTGVAVVIEGRPDRGDGTKDEPELFTTPPKAGTPLKTTLDPAVQNAADLALAAQPKRSALVAIRVSDGAILAVAHGPSGGDLNLAFGAQVPPGSTFKMVTALGLLDNGSVTMTTPVNCPQTLIVQGKPFKNSNNFSLGTVPFRVDFAKSCNTAFASLAPKLGADGLNKAAASVGIGVPWQLGTEVYTGQVGKNQSPVAAAAAAFGQGTTQVSPAALAAAAAAVARGSWLQPKLFTEAPAGATLATAPPTPLKATSVSALRTMMREVVTAGTGTGLKGVPGGPVYAKTGTAEFDNNPAHTHAWTIGWQGDIAFAVFVENGGSSTTTAVPLVAAFLRNL